MYSMDSDIKMVPFSGDCYSSLWDILPCLLLSSPVQNELNMGDGRDWILSIEIYSILCSFCINVKDDAECQAVEDFIRLGRQEEMGHLINHMEVCHLICR